MLIQQPNNKVILTNVIYDCTQITVITTQVILGYIWSGPGR